MSYEGYVTREGLPHDCGPYCEHPGPNGVHEATPDQETSE